MEDYPSVHEKASTSQGLSTIEERISPNSVLNIHSSFNLRDDFYKLELKTEQFENFDSFKNAVEDNLRHLSKKICINPTRLNETCLDIASKNGLTGFVKSLLDQDANSNKINDEQNSAPLHFATEGKHLDSLETLLKHPKTNPNLQVKGQTALHIAVQKNDLNCARLLLDGGASANIPDNKGLTALHLAVKKNEPDMVKLILEKCQQRPNLDEYDDEREETIREMIQRYMPELLLSISPPIPEDSSEDSLFLENLKYYLRVNDEENFVNNINHFYGDEALKDLLETAVERDFHKAVRAIGINCRTKSTIKRQVQKAVHIAVHRGNYNTLRELLNIDLLEPKVANELILKACTELENRVADDISNHLECLKIILEAKLNVRFTDDQGNTPLHYVTRADCHEAITLFLKHGSYIGYTNKFNEPPIAKIPPDILSKHFDNCVKFEENLEFDYQCLMPHKTDDKIACEMKTFMHIAHNKHLKHLLKHPLLTSFLYIKWHRIRYFLYVNFIFYVIFYLLLNSYIFCVINDVRTKNETNANDTSDMILETVWYRDIILWLFVVMLSLFIFREIFQLASCPRRYLKNLNNWLQIVLIVLILIMLCTKRLWIYIEIGAVVILLSAWKLMTMIGHHPSMSTGIEMFRTVSFNFARIFSPYLSLIFAFALIFYIFFKENEHFSEISLSIFKTIIMLTGEFNANDSDIPYSVWSRIVFLLFVFFIPIVLLNLLNGLAVSNTTEILNKAELIGLISRIRLILYFEGIMSGNPFKFFKFKFLRHSFSFLIKRIFLFSYFMEDGTIKFNKKTNNDMCYISLLHNGNLEFSRILKMDPNIIKDIEQMHSNKNQTSTNGKIMITLKELQEKFTLIEDVLNNILK